MVTISIVALLLIFFPHHPSSLALIPIPSSRGSADVDTINNKSNNNNNNNNSGGGRREFLKKSATALMITTTTSVIVFPSLAHAATMMSSDYTTSIYDLYNDDCQTDCFLDCALSSKTSTSTPTSTSWWTNKLRGRNNNDNNNANECERKCVRTGRRYCQDKTASLSSLSPLSSSKTIRYVVTTKEPQIVPAKRIPGLRLRWRDEFFNDIDDSNSNTSTMSQ
ncbi:hypothetical protein FRACYDRAFT_238231 [Fragilariopsis cylindrus CCMP1102]|uniref:Uncharacterized protein n=1 Tax=Fragilariopsis cylindrus CCMP1102 TaxID=635003 RepID=A0A1E7FIE0_9STRA|nr:hypothetical protein FRACYDRAFT_238231 [Fragilariopsis cylindrus CCMP1102]|eukprot:OEU17805.1 hypothetical protein FRACYDRAFT_238231 [Fragilariopsis cylindrus CCMP1102]